MNTEEQDIACKFTGKRFTIVHCNGAYKSFSDSLASLPANKAKSLKRQMVLQITKLANGDRMSKENFPQEGLLPSLKGQHKKKKFNALKRLPIRGYCWLSDKYENTYFISHYIHKKTDKLKDKDVQIVGNNWTRIEVNGDEC